MVGEGTVQREMETDCEETKVAASRKTSEWK